MNDDTRTGFEQLDALPAQFREGGGPKAADIMQCIVMLVNEEHEAALKVARAEAWDQCTHAMGDYWGHGREWTGNPYRDEAEQ